MTPDKVLEAVKLIKTGEIVSLGMPYDARMPIAPGRAYALRMLGGPTGGPYGAKSKTIWNDEFIAAEIGQIGTQMDALGHIPALAGTEREYLLWVDVTCWPGLQLMSAICGYCSLMGSRARPIRCRRLRMPVFSARSFGA